MISTHRFPIRPLARISLAVGLLALVGCVSSPDKRVLQYLNTDGFGKRYVGSAFQDDYLTIGDQIVFKDTYNSDPSVNGQATVAIDGTIDFGPMGRVWVAGMTVEQAEVYLTEKAAAAFTQSDIQVVLGTKPKGYFIFGEVGKEGVQQIKGDLTLFEAVMLAKPSENSANLGRVRLIRADPVDPLVITANLGQILTVGDSTFNPTIEENDIIVVPPTMLAQVGYFVADLIYPFTTVFKTVFQGLIGLSNVGNKFNNNNQNNIF
jgi:protein involved in polysaccharide export with SLBB domain